MHEKYNLIGHIVHRRRKENVNQIRSSVGKMSLNMSKYEQKKQTYDTVSRTTETQQQTSTQTCYHGRQTLKKWSVASCS